MIIWNLKQRKLFNLIVAIQLIEILVINVVSTPQNIVPATPNVGATPGRPAGTLGPDDPGSVGSVGQVGQAAFFSGQPLNPPVQAAPPPDPYLDQWLAQNPGKTPPNIPQGQQPPSSPESPTSSSSPSPTASSSASPSSSSSTRTRTTSTSSPTNRPSDNQSDGSSSQGPNLTPGAIAGIVIAALVASIVAFVILRKLSRRHDKTDDDDDVEGGYGQSAPAAGYGAGNGNMGAPEVYPRSLQQQQYYRPDASQAISYMDKALPSTGESAAGSGFGVGAGAAAGVAAGAIGAAAMAGRRRSNGDDDGDDEQSSQQQQNQSEMYRSSQEPPLVIPPPPIISPSSSERAKGEEVMADNGKNLTTNSDNNSRITSMEFDDNDKETALASLAFAEDEDALSGGAEQSVTQEMLSQDASVAGSDAVKSNAPVAAGAAVAGLAGAAAVGAMASRSAPPEEHKYVRDSMVMSVDDDSIKQMQDEDDKTDDNDYSRGMQDVETSPTAEDTGSISSLDLEPNALDTEFTQADMLHSPDPRESMIVDHSAVAVLGDDLEEPTADSQGQQKMEYNDDGDDEMFNQQQSSSRKESLSDRSAGEVDENSEGVLSDTDLVELESHSPKRRRLLSDGDDKENQVVQEISSI
ncbi:hypothetical protein MIR68_012396 [Amoeboaphelidium protococcarum]|nr:hypothetical protein MIR68_012396 [Amoeboaphelidium protococcarum]